MLSLVIDHCAITFGIRSTGRNTLDAGFASAHFHPDGGDVWGISVAALPHVTNLMAQSFLPTPLENKIMITGILEISIALMVL